MSTESVDTLIIGAGLAGLSAAVRLHEAGREFLILEGSDAVGGRVRTDEMEGFLLDRGFQVYLDAYPEAGALLDLEKLDLHRFEPGALVWRKGKLRRLMDVFRRPGSLFSSALQPIGNALDKFLVAKLRAQLIGKSQDAIWSSPESTTADYLRHFGFSERMIDHFFRGFYGGIFLEDHLVTSSRMFEFTFGMFSRGNATLPARGMQAIPDQLGSRIPGGMIRLNHPIESLEGTIVKTAGHKISARSVIIATDGTTAARLIPHRVTSPRWNSTTCLYFSASEPPFTEQLIALKGDREGLINHVCVPSLISGSYAPPGKSLISVTVIGIPGQNEAFTEQIASELMEWFGPVVTTWTHLKSYRIVRALPVPVVTSSMSAMSDSAPGVSQVYLCGDHISNASIEGAITSGLNVASRISAR